MMDYSVKNLFLAFVGVLFFLMTPRSLDAVAQTACPVNPKCPPITNAPGSVTPGSTIYNVPADLTPTQMTAVQNAISAVNALSQSLGLGITLSISTDGSGDAGFNVSLNAGISADCPGAIACNVTSSLGTVRTNSTVVVNLGSTVQLANGSTVAAFNPRLSSYGSALQSTLTHEFAHSLGMPDVKSTSDIMGFYSGQNDTGNTGKTFSACDKAAIQLIRNLLKTGRTCGTPSSG